MNADDEKRRQVAAELRELAKSRHYVDEFIAGATVGFWRGEATEGFDSDSLLEVADLIDRGTCRNVYNEDDPQACANGFECDVCGNRVEDCEHYAITGKFEYCSGCGRVVVE